MWPVWLRVGVDTCGRTPLQRVAEAREVAAALLMSRTNVLFVISTKDTCCPIEQEGPYFDTLTASGLRVLCNEMTHHDLYEYLIMGGGFVKKSREEFALIEDCRCTLLSPD